MLAIVTTPPVVVRTRASSTVLVNASSRVRRLPRPIMRETAAPCARVLSISPTRYSCVCVPEAIWWSAVG